MYYHKENNTNFMLIGQRGQGPIVLKNYIIKKLNKFTVFRQCKKNNTTLKYSMFSNGEVYKT